MAIWVTSGSFLLLIILTFDTLSKTQVGGSRVPAYAVINQVIDYQPDSATQRYEPVIGGQELLFGKAYTEAEAEALISLGKKPRREGTA